MGAILYQVTYLDLLLPKVLCIYILQTAINLDVNNNRILVNHHLLTGCRNKNYALAYSVFVMNLSPLRGENYKNENNVTKCSSMARAKLGEDKEVHGFPTQARSKQLKTHRFLKYSWRYDQVTTRWLLTFRCRLQRTVYNQLVREFQLRFIR